MRLRETSILMIILGGYACGGQNTNDQGKGENAAEQKFFSKDNPGIWKDYKDDHDIKVTVKKEKYRKIIQVNVPMKVTPEHYIEVIVLQDYKGKELESKSYKRGETPVAEFFVPAEFKEPVTIIGKCNLHDMWQTKVNLSQ